jgi:thermitase
VRIALALVVVGAALVAAAPAAAFTPANEYYPKQWYLAQDHAFDFWPAAPELAPIKVAIIDSGVDCSLPDLQGQVFAALTFVSGPGPCKDTDGHGTIVAGEIAAALDTGGIVGLAPSAQLLVAKVVAPDGTIPLHAEAAAIRWAANRGARVINLSLGGVRDPADPTRDTYSKQEAAAVAYAWKKGAVVVAAVGNSDDAYATPWPYASWPSALPHVIGVGALNRSGSVPDFSDRDRRYVDIAAPGVSIFSTFPSDLTAQQVGCTPQGYTGCAAGDYAQPDGTSFAAPQVSAAAAVLLGTDPALTNNQVATILERASADVNASTGCSFCPTGRDKYSGWGELDVAVALERLTSVSTPLPAADHYEPNDSVAQAPKLWGNKRIVHAALDFWDDHVDYYRIRLRKGQRLQARAVAKWRGAKVRLAVLEQERVTEGRRHQLVARRAARSASAHSKQHLSFRVPRTGWYFVELQVTRPGGGGYTLKLAKLNPQAQ